MNSNWKDLLLSKNANFINDTCIIFSDCEQLNDRQVFPLAHLACLTISGNDASTFLQGQITCNINEVSESQSTIGAMCNPKGRVITTFLLVKTKDDYVMVLPVELLEIVKKRLQMYILRSKVTIIDMSYELCLTGVYDKDIPAQTLFATHQLDIIEVNLGHRHLIIAQSEKTLQLWNQHLQQGFQAANSESWIYLDILSGIPWLGVKTTEEFIPQMLNLDKLGGISFNKGCYTGQEVVARTHYLGKSKRAMFLAEYDNPDTPEANEPIIDDSTGEEQTVGNVLLTQKDRMLIVLQLSEPTIYHLKLKNQQQLTLLNITTE